MVLCAVMIRRPWTQVNSTVAFWMNSAVIQLYLITSAAVIVRLCRHDVIVMLQRSRQNTGGG